MRFRAEQRLRRQRDFRTARERGRRIDCGGFTLWYVRRAPEGFTPGGAAVTPPENADSPSARPRVGVVASTAAVGCAIERNRAKRRLREVFRLHQTLVPPDVDLLLVARKSLNALAFTEIQRKFVDACQKAFSSSK